MKDRKLSKKTQVLASIGVFVVFGGAAGAACFWPHIQFKRLVARADAETRAKWVRAELRQIPDAPPPGWIPIDLGIATVSVPSPVLDCAVSDHPQFRITTKELTLTIVSLDAGRDLMKAAAQDYASGTDVLPTAFTERAIQAAFSSPDDFRWTMRWHELWGLQDALLFKAVGQKPVRPTAVFQGAHTHGVASFVDANLPECATILCSPLDDRDLLCCYCLPSRPVVPHVLSHFLASIRFPPTRCTGSTSETQAKLEALAASLQTRE